MKIKKNKKEKTSTLSNQKTAVYSYYKSDNSQKSETKRSNKQRFTIPPVSKFIYAAIILGIVSFMTYYSLIKKADTIIINVEENTTPIRNHEDYDKVVQDFVNSSILNHSKITFDNQGLTEGLKGTFPEIQTVETSTNIFSNTLSVKVGITQPVFALETPNKIAVVGENGVTLSVWDKQEFNDIGALKRVIDLSGIEPEPGKPAFPREQTLFVAIINEQLQKQNLEVESLTVTTSPYDLHVKLSGKNYYVKFNVLEDPKQQAGTLVAFINNEESRGAVVNEYVDVRVEERLFYR
ncbi:hypothetical protein KC950_01325 [Candidatus Saccharibacteria bacterium]|nr:hypothetical protein [Candidatus Saccharibacteria bacterium]